MQNIETKYQSLPSPCWLLEEAKLVKNLELLQMVKDQSGAKVLLALK